MISPHIYILVYIFMRNIQVIKWEKPEPKRELVITPSLWLSLLLGTLTSEVLLSRVTL